MQNKTPEELEQTHEQDTLDVPNDGCENDSCEHTECDNASCEHEECNADACDHDDCDCACHHCHEHVPVRELDAQPTFTYQVKGVDCPSCAAQVQNAVRLCETVEDASFNYATVTLSVVKEVSASDYACEREVLQAVRSTGHDLDLPSEKIAELSAERPWYVEHREELCMGVSGISLLLGLAVYAFGGPAQEALARGLFSVSAIAGIIYLLPLAVASLRRRTADMNVLMCIAVIGALAMGESAEAGMVVVLYELGEWLEGLAMRRSRGSITKLMELAPDIAHVIEGDEVNDMEVVNVEEGSRIRILAGERVPLDGRIVSGASSFNEAPVTGESVPVDKSEGDEVYAGTLNTHGVVEVVTTSDADESTLARIISQVQGAQAEKAPYESFINRFAAVYTPLVVCGAGILAVCVPTILGIAVGFDHVDWGSWVYRALSLLVVACPCALVISTPVSFVSAITRAAKMGVLVKGGGNFDTASQLSAIALDKTGTLTQGHPEVVEVVAFEGWNEAQVISAAAALEQGSTHPLASAVLSRAQEAQVVITRVEDVEEVFSQGMRGTLADKTVTVGRLSFAQEQAPCGPQVSDAVNRLAHRGASALVVTLGDDVLGVIGIADALRPSATEAIRQIKSLKQVELVEMLTGDNLATGQAVAAQAGVDGVAAELKPADKAERIRALRDQGHTVAMVGDGVNDAPALASAHLGVTMGAAASDTALEVADVALLGDDLTLLPAFLRLSRRTMNVVRENIVFAILVKALVFVLVVLGVAGMGAAVFADTGVAVLVILNGMRLMLKSDTSW